MRERSGIVAGLVLFVGLVTFPFWYARVSGMTARGPEPRRPEREPACVMPVEYMRTSHMDLLVTWRDRVVRENVRTWTSPDGRTYRIGLTGTCLRCHVSKSEFCDRCHAYASVSPSCWGCHVDRASPERSAP